MRRFLCKFNIFCVINVFPLCPVHLHFTRINVNHIRVVRSFRDAWELDSIDSRDVTYNLLKIAWKEIHRMKGDIFLPIAKNQALLYLRCRYVTKEMPKCLHLVPLARNTTRVLTNPTNNDWLKFSLFRHMDVNETSYTSWNKEEAGERARSQRDEVSREISLRGSQPSRGNIQTQGAYYKRIK